MESIKIGTREFSFTRITLARQEQIEAKLVNRKQHKRFQKIFNRLYWRKFCRLAFVMDFKWKYLGLVPNELKYSNVSLKDFGGIQAAFFGYYGAIAKELGEQFKSFGNSGTQNPT